MPAPKLPGRLGTYVASSVAGETVRAFIPPPLPPADWCLARLLFSLNRAFPSVSRRRSRVEAT